jgi:hypothetical protein
VGDVDILHATVHGGAAQVRPWIKRLARIGIAARGAVYLMVGVLAARKALGDGGETLSPKEAVHHMGRGAFGDVLLAGIAAGLIGYGLWRCIQGIHDTDAKGNDGKGLAVRALYLGKGLVHFALAATPIRLLMDRPDGGDGMKSWTARALSHEAGPWVVGAIGAVVVGAGVYQVYRGVKRKFLKNLDDQRLQSTARTWAHRAGTFGYAARGVTLGVVGWFLIQAARQADPGEARGLGEALDVLLRQPQGPWLMGIVALGLAAYGLYSFVEARYRRIRT